MVIEEHLGSWLMVATLTTVWQVPYFLALPHMCMHTHTHGGKHPAQVGWARGWALGPLPTTQSCHHKPLGGVGGAVKERFQVDGNYRNH